ncbi:hypothetical protein RHSIM_Rhsim13G0137700 [Rhododendron simsii]|uniref:Protein ENDOSPERM DEFECTIVE 1 n=1 Tax=Rhododendron simsii TaxID=118357 RepID=A0A834L665_RHOSS|nr:hypothetical protein RHSIM_Rhsim13G0137700 [Rhododendron simsii]
MKDSIADQVTPTEADSVPPLPPPSRHQRPRVREVSSRFMSSIVPSSPGDLHHHQNHHHVPKSPISKHTPMPTPEIHSRPLQRSKSAQRQRGGGGGRQEIEAAEPLSSRAADDNNIQQLDTARSLESPLKGLHSVKGSVVQRNNKRGASVKLIFKENNGGKSENQQSEVLRRRGGNFTTPSRPDTPTVSTTSTGTDHRVVSSRYRLSGTVQKGINITTTTAAAKLLLSSGMMSSSFNAAQLPPNPHASNSNGNGGTLGRENDTFPTPSNPSSDCGLGSDSEEDVVQQDSRLWSSLPEVDVSTRLLGDRSCTMGNNAVGCNSSKFSASSPCSRSLNLPLSSYEHSSSLLHTVGRAGEKPTKPLGNSGKMGSLCLPPLPCPKAGGDLKKGRKDSSHVEQVHSLKLLHNHHLQWRFANAKAEASMHAQRRETERDLYSLQVKISNLRDAVKRKQIELGLWKRTQTLSTILEAHMPNLDEWSTLEGEYLSSLSGVIDALVNASLQLPVGGNVQVDVSITMFQADIKEVREALNAALKMTESICSHIQNFVPKAEEMDTSISELARVSGGERALVEECGHLLFKTYTSQVEECSLRGHLIQLHSSNHHQAKEE